MKYTREEAIEKLMDLERVGIGETVSSDAVPSQHSTFEFLVLVKPAPFVLGATPKPELGEMERRCFELTSMSDGTSLWKRTR